MSDRQRHRTTELNPNPETFGQKVPRTFRPKSTRYFFRFAKYAVLLGVVVGMLVMARPAFAAVAHEATLTDSNDGTGDTMTINSVTSGTDQLYLLAVTMYATSASVSTVDDGTAGMTWSLKKKQCSARISQPSIEVWQAFGSPGSSFTLTVTMSGNVRASSAISRFSGADTTTQTEGVDGSNYNGQGGSATCGDGTVDTDTATIDITSVADNAILYSATHPRHRTITTPDADYTQRAFVSNVSGGDGANLYVHSRTNALTPVGTDTISHTLSSDADWDMIGLAIRPAPTNSAPATPSQTLPFDHQQSADATPAFTFSTTDPDADAVEYELRWDTDFNFGGPTTKASANYPTDTGWTAATFSSGASVTYTIQAADELAHDTTYWWQVRARDPSGTNTWSSWSAKRSLTVDILLTSYEWHQTTEEQFDTGTLTGKTDATATDDVRVTGP